MSYPTAYRTATARSRANPGFQRPPGTVVRGPGFDRHARSATFRRQTHPARPGGSAYFRSPGVIPELAKVGIKIGARALPWYRFWRFLRWLDRRFAPQLFGIAYNGWAIDFSCPTPPSVVSTAFCNFCCDNQLITPSSWGALGNTVAGVSRAGTFQSYYRPPPNLQQPWYRLSQRLIATRSGINPLPDIVILNENNPPAVMQPKPENFGQPQPRPMPWEMIPYIREEPNAPGPIRRRDEQPEWEPAQRPRQEPTRDPFQYPRPEHYPAPDIWINPGTRPLPRWWRWPAPRTAPGIRSREWLRNNPLVDPAPAPGAAPAPAVQPARPGGVTRTAPGHRFQRPGRKTKETKKRPRQGALQRLARRLVGGVTEGLDAMDCVYGALPEQLRKREQAKRHGRNPKVADKMALIYRNYKSIDVVEFYKCFAKEQIQDAAIGMVQRKHAKLRKKYGIQGGYLSRQGKTPGVFLKP